MIILIKFIKSLLIVASVCLLYIFFNNLITFQGNKFIYFIFSIISFYLVISIFYEKKYFSEIFLSIYLWLGFWWKFSVLQTLSKISLTKDQRVNMSDNIISLSRSEGFHPKIVDPEILNEVFLTLSLAFIVLLASFRFFKYFNKDYFNNQYKEETFFSNLYAKNRIPIITSYIFLFIFIAITNFYFGIYQKGLSSSQNINPLILNLYKWLILFGISFIGSLILYYETRSKTKNIFWFSIIVLFENLVITSSLLSRAMIVNSSAIIFGNYKNLLVFDKEKNFLQFFKKRKNFFLFFKLIIILVIFFIISFIASVELRKLSFNWDYDVTEKIILENSQKIDDLNKNEEEEKKEYKHQFNNAGKIIHEIFYLASSRWIGMESMIIVTEHDKRNFNHFFSSFDDRFSAFDNSYYEKVFLYRFANNIKTNEEVFPDRKLALYNKNGQKLYGVITPGFITFFHFANNIFFLLFSIFLIGILILYFEKLISFLSGNNLILVSFLSHIVVYRLIHFGYLPHQTYLLFGTLLLNLLVLYFFKKIYFNLKNKLILF